MSKRNSKLGRVLTPSFVVSILGWLRYGAKISPRSEVELNRNLIMGRGCVISSYCKIKAGDGVMRFGDHVEIATHCFLAAGTKGLEIGDYTMVGPLCCIVSSNYTYDRLDIPISLQPGTSKGIRIGKGVWIGAGVMVADGADIGDNVIVTPNSVVSGRVPANTIVQGNPAKVIFERR